VPFTQLLFARDGITWYGGLVMGIVVGAIGCRVHGVSIKKVMDCTAVAVAVGQALGRVGCFLVGDDYGVATDLPWGIAFPDGAPPTLVAVHPTQLYEVLWLLPVAALLWRRRHRSPFLFGEYLVANGFGRIFIETLRVNPKVAFGLTEPQIVGAVLVVLGVSSWLYFQRHEPVAA
jgi:phosphatidylglycerol:prolipoprotein diacylglycerol transferase